MQTRFSAFWTAGIEPNIGVKSLRFHFHSRALQTWNTICANHRENNRLFEETVWRVGTPVESTLEDYTWQIGHMTAVTLAFCTCLRVLTSNMAVLSLRRSKSRQKKLVGLSLESQYLESRSIVQFLLDDVWLLYSETGMTKTLRVAGLDPFLSLFVNYHGGLATGGSYW